MEPQQDNFSQPNSKRKLIVSLAVLLVAVLLVAGVKAFASGKDSDSDGTASNASNAASTSSTSSSSSDSSASNNSYKDGTYSASGSYTTPETQEEIKVTVTLKDGKVSDVSASTDPQARESQEWQSRFLSGYKQLVVGKSIDSIKLSRVSGSSLTSGGFNKAINTIKQQAKA
jgi:uncharacterized protein with FMN-binding domain